MPPLRRDAATAFLRRDVVVPFFSTEGCQQGDPLGPFLWAVGYHESLLRTQARHPSSLIVAYLDDTYSCDEPLEALACMRTNAAITAGPVEEGGCGVVSNVTKQCIYSPAGDLSALPAACGLKGSLDHEGGRLRGIKVLGAFVGETEWCAAQLCVRVERALEQLPAICRLRDAGPRLNTAAQIRALLLRHCANTTLVYFMRCMPPEATEAAARLHDRLIEDAFLQSVGAHAATTEERDFAVMQARLPVKLGGMGLTSMMDIQRSAWVGSWALCWEPMQRLHVPFRAISLEVSALPHIVSLRAAHAASLADHARVVAAYAELDTAMHAYSFDKEGNVNARFHPEHFVPADELVPIRDFTSGSEFLKQAQRRHSLVVHHSRWLELLRRTLTERGRRETVRVLAASQPHAGDFLNAVPARLPFRMPSWAMRIAVQRRLGLPLGEAAGAGALLAGERVDPLGDVAQNDNAAGHAGRHKTLLAAVFDAVRSVWGGSAQREPHDHKTYSSGYRPDLVALYAVSGSHHVIGDLKFFDPLASAFARIGAAGAYVAFGNTRPAARAAVLGRGQRGVEGDGCFNPATGEGYVAPLEADYRHAILQQHDVVPLLFETFGGFSPEAVAFMRRLRDEVGNKLTKAQYEATTWAARNWLTFQCQKISVALHKAAAFEIACELGILGAREGAGDC